MQTRPKIPSGEYVIKWRMEQVAGGTTGFIISHNRQRNGYEIANLFPQPPTHSLPGR